MSSCVVMPIPGSGVGVIVGVFVGALVGVWVRVGVGVEVAVRVAVGVAVDVAVAVGVNVGVAVMVGVGVNVGPKSCPGPQPEIKKLNRKNRWIRILVFRIAEIFPLVFLHEFKFVCVLFYQNAIGFCPQNKILNQAIIRI